MMWRSRRQTKKHKVKNRPRKIAEVVYYVFGLFAIAFVIYSLFSFTKQPALILPVASFKSVMGMNNVLTSDESGVDEIERQLSEKNIDFLFVTVASDAAYIVTLPNSAEVVMKKENISFQIASLQVITMRLTMEGKRFSRLDLRFDRPVIVLK